MDGADITQICVWVFSAMFVFGAVCIAAIVLATIILIIVTNIREWRSTRRTPHQWPDHLHRRRNVTPVKTGAGIQKHFWPVTFSFPVGSWIPASAGTTGRGTFS